MAKTYANSWAGTPNPDNVLILGIREAFRMPFDVGSWTSLRMAAFISMTDTVADNTGTPPSETVGSGASNNVAFGIKTNNDIIPGNVGTDFLGWGSNLGVQYSTTGFYFSSTGPGGTHDTTSTGLSGNSPLVHASGAVRLWMATYDVANKGLANQTVTVKTIQSTSTPATFTISTLANLRGVVGSQTLTSSQIVTWNNGVSAYALPDAVYMRVPFGTLRLRIHSLYVEKMA